MLDKALDPSRDRALPLLQFVARPGIIDLGWGHPAPELLPVVGLNAAAQRVFDRYGVDALGYGYAAGPGPLIEWLSDWIGRTDGRRPHFNEISISAGTSQALDHITTLLAHPGDVVLVENPTYHLSIRILRDHPVKLEPIAIDDAGISIDALHESLGRLRKARWNVRFLYTVPTFGNPTSVSMTVERRRELVRLAAEEGLLIVEDDAYRELSYDGPPPPSLWSLGLPGTVIRLGSFAKTLAPGLRCGFITADPKTVTRIGDSGLLDSGGAISHFAALVVGEFATDGEYARHIEHLRTAFRARRDVLLASLTEQIESAASWSPPGGGYYVWLTLSRGDAACLLATAEASGMSFLPGTVFSIPPSAASRSLRLSFSLYSPEELGEAARRLSLALRRV
jgi:2-aminoadipate transaminase